jgi:hypothetical protein
MNWCMYTSRKVAGYSPLHGSTALDYYRSLWCEHEVMSLWMRRGVKGSTDVHVLKPFGVVVGSWRASGLVVGARRHRWSQSARPCKRSNSR